jgi:hypothetical protein
MGGLIIWQRIQGKRLNVPVIEPTVERRQNF